MEVGRQAKIMPEVSKKIKDFGIIGNMFYQLFSKYRSGSFETGLNMYDSLAVGLILNPDMFETVKTRVEIETVGKLTTGASLIDLNGYLNLPANAEVATHVDPNKFEKWFVASIAKTF